MGSDYEKLQYIGSTIPALVEGLDELAKIEKELVDLQIKYKNSDYSILRVLKKRFNGRSFKK